MKKNTRVRLLDTEKLHRRKRQRRGRPITRVHRIMSVSTYFKKYGTVQRRTLPELDGKQVEIMQATLILETYGRVTVIAVRFPGDKEWSYLMTGRQHTNALRLVRHYRQRWRIERMHQEAKECFGWKKPIVRTWRSTIALVALSLMAWASFRTTAEYFQRTYHQKLTAWKCMDALCVTTTYWETPPVFEPLSP